MIVKLVEIYQEGGVSSYSDNSPPRQNYSLREIYINSEKVISFRDDPVTSKKLESGLLSLNLDKRQEFTKLQLISGNSHRNLVVVGGPNSIAEKLNNWKRPQLLKG